MKDRSNFVPQLGTSLSTILTFGLLSRSWPKTLKDMQWALFFAWTFLAGAIVIGAGLARSETPGQRARVKDVASIEGIRDNQLVGYGLVVGLRGTGDSSQTVFPAQTLISALERLGVTVPQTGSNSASNMQVKNMAAVFVVATLPPFSRPGYLLARDQDIPQVLSALDGLAFGISTQVNALNNSGSNLNGATGTAANPLYIFSEPAVAAGSATGMSVVMTNPSEIAAAALGHGSGDNSNAGALAALATKAIVNGLTPTNFYSDFVTALGSVVSQVQTENTAQIASVTQLQTTRDSLSSVNLNDQAALMQQFERSYQAASRVFAILNTVMSSALNLGVQTAAS
jgi:flagellar hook-associated protein FlgK